MSESNFWLVLEYNTKWKLSKTFKAYTNDVSSRRAPGLSKLIPIPNGHNAWDIAYMEVIHWDQSEGEH